MKVSLIVRGRDPADQVPDRAGLVVRARGAGAAERLLPDDGAGRLVVDVEVAGGVAEAVRRLLDGRAILGEDRAGQPVGRRRVDQVERVVPVLLVVDVRRDDGAEELVAQQPEVRVAGLDHRRLDEEALRVVGAAADDDLGPVVGARLGDRIALRRERARVDHGAHEVAEVGDVADLDRRHLLGEPLAQRRPEVRGRVDARGRRALLALVLERAAHDRGRERVDVGRRVGDDEVLAAGLADDARVVAVAARCSRPTVCHIPLKTPVEPVKWMPASSGLASAASPISAPEP